MPVPPGPLPDLDWLLANEKTDALAAKLLAHFHPEFVKWRAEQDKRRSFADRSKGVGGIAGRAAVTGARTDSGSYNSRDTLAGGRKRVTKRS